MDFRLLQRVGFRQFFPLLSVSDVNEIIYPSQPWRFRAVE